MSSQDRRHGPTDRRAEPRIVRPFAPLALGIEDHLTWLKGTRLSVFILVVLHTKDAPWWTGWRLSDVARTIDVTERQARRALAELHAVAPIPPRGQTTGRRYIDWKPGVGRRPNKVKVLHWIKGAYPDTGVRLATHMLNTCGNPVEKSGVSGHGCPVKPDMDVRLDPSYPDMDVRLAASNPNAVSEVAGLLDPDPEESGEREESVALEIVGEVASDAAAVVAGAPPPAPPDPEADRIRLIAEMVEQLRTAGRTRRP